MTRPGRPHGVAGDLVRLAAAVVGSAAAAQVIGRHVDGEPDTRAEQAAQAQEHTCDSAFTDPGLTRAGEGYAWVVGANERRLIIKRMGDGVYLGGCLISDRALLRELAAYLAAEAGFLPGGDT